MNFYPGQSVFYKPRLDSPPSQWEPGVVTSVTRRYVFVKFNPNNLTGIACSPQDLVGEEEVKGCDIPSHPI